MTDCQSARQKILEIAAERDKNLHLLPTVADSDDVQHALEAIPSVLPERGLGVQEVVDTILRDVVPGLAPGHAGPRYFGLVTGGVLPAAQLAEFITTIYDQNASINRTEETITAAIEARALEFVLDLLRLPCDKFPARILTSGATASNVLGLAIARDYAVRNSLGSPTHSVSEDGFGGVTVKVFTDRPHASIFKAAAIVGIGRANVIDLGKRTDGNGTIGIELEELEDNLKTAGPGGRKAAIVVLSFGEVNTGDFTPNVREIRRLCDKYSTWLHIDGAFGAFARLLPDLVGSLADGLELADSITLDAHKWLNVPYDCGIFFSNSIQDQSSVFGPSPNKPPPAYLARPTERPSPESLTLEIELSLRIPDPMNMTIENSRRFRALPLYAALLNEGREGYTDIIRRNISFARRVAKWMCSPESKAYYEVLNLRTYISGEPTVPLNILLFRAASTCPVEEYRGAAGAGSLVKAINATKKMYVTPAEGTVRIAVSNWSTGFASVRENGKEIGDFEIVTGVLLSVVESPRS